MNMSKRDVELSHIAVNPKETDRFNGLYSCAGCHKIFIDEIGMAETTCPKCGCHASVFNPAEDMIIKEK